MKIVRTIGITIFVILLNGCVVIGGMMDAMLFDDKEGGDFFQKIGKEIDKDTFTSESERLSRRKAAERNCQYLQQPQEACLEAKKLIENR